MQTDLKKRQSGGSFDLSYFSKAGQKGFYSLSNRAMRRDRKMAFESGKTLGGIGALLLVIGSFVPFLNIVGLILLLIGLKNLADYYGDQKIFNDALYALIFGIIGAVAAGFALASLFFGASLFGIGTSIGEGFAAFFGAIILVLVVVLVFYLLMAIYFRRAFDSLAKRSGVGMFGTAGLLLLIGAILTIVIIGLVLLFVAWILLTVAFFSMRESPAPQQPPAPPPN